MLSELKIRELLNKCDEGQEETEFAIAFAHAVEAEVRKQDTELIRRMLEALEKVDQAMPFPVARQEITAARKRLENT